MALMNEADKIGSDIESYLGNLDRVLLKELDSIHEMRNKYLLINFRIASISKHLV
jgi:hypothetical protein